MFRRDLRGSDTWCGLHNIAILVMTAKHETYRRWRCVKHQNCDKTHDPEKEFVESFDVEPDTFAWTATGQEASATCTTNFMVVAVDVKIGDVGEEGEETEGVLLSRMSDEVPQNARNWKESVKYEEDIDNVHDGYIRHDASRCGG